MPKPPANPVLPQHVDVFKAFVDEWQVKFNLMDWRITRSSKKASKGNMAEISKRYVQHRLAAWQIGDDFGGLPVDEHSLEEAAVHELLHVLLAELIEAVRQDLPHEQQMAAEHRVIITLLNLLVPKP